MEDDINDVLVCGECGSDKIVYTRDDKEHCTYYECSNCKDAGTLYDEDDFNGYMKVPWGGFL